MLYNAIFLKKTYTGYFFDRTFVKRLSTNKRLPGRAGAPSVISWGQYQRHQNECRGFEFHAFFPLESLSFLTRFQIIRRVDKGGDGFMKVFERRLMGVNHMTRLIKMERDI